MNTLTTHTLLSNTLANKETSTRYRVGYYSAGCRGTKFGPEGPSEHVLQRKSTASFCKHLGDFKTREAAQVEADRLNAGKTGKARCFWAYQTYDFPEYASRENSVQYYKVASPAQAAKPAPLYKVQAWDEDCECWQDDDSFAPASKFDAEDDMRALKRSYASYVRLRVVPA